MGSAPPRPIDGGLGIMRSKATPKENPAAGVVPRAPWRVVHVESLPGFRLAVRFVDGTEGEVDLSGLVTSSQAGVFARLSDPALFAQVFVDRGAIAWPGELDLAPDAM